MAGKGRIIMLSIKFFIRNPIEQLEDYQENLENIHQEEIILSPTFKKRLMEEIGELRRKDYQFQTKVNLNEKSILLIFKFDTITVLVQLSQFYPLECPQIYIFHPSKGEEKLDIKKQLKWNKGMHITTIIEYLIKESIIPIKEPQTNDSPNINSENDNQMLLNRRVKSEIDMLMKQGYSTTCRIANYGFLLVIKVGQENIYMKLQKSYPEVLPQVFVDNNKAFKQKYVKDKEIDLTKLMEWNTSLSLLDVVMNIENNVLKQLGKKSIDFPNNRSKIINQINNIDNPINVEYSKSAIDTICDETLIHAPYETSGLLLGYLEDNTMKIIRSTNCGNAHSRGGAHITPNTRYLNKCIKEAENEGLRFLGEWHSHPGFNMNYPSAGDDATIKEIIGKNNLDFYIAGIITTNNGGIDINSYLYIDGGRKSHLGTLDVDKSLDLKAISKTIETAPQPMTTTIPLKSLPNMIQGLEIIDNKLKSIPLRELPKGIEELQTSNYKMMTGCNITMALHEKSLEINRKLDQQRTAIIIIDLNNLKNEPKIYVNDNKNKSMVEYKKKLKTLKSWVRPLSLYYIFDEILLNDFPPSIRSQIYKLWKKKIKVHMKIKNFTKSIYLQVPEIKDRTLVVRLYEKKYLTQKRWHFSVDLEPCRDLINSTLVNNKGELILQCVSKPKMKEILTNIVKELKKEWKKAKL